MAAQICAIYFAIYCELHQYSDDNNEPMTFPGIMSPSYDTIETIEKT